MPKAIVMFGSAQTDAGQVFYAAKLFNIKTKNPRVFPQPPQIPSISD